ncbi:MAG TPA: M28 family peptidase [Candidatus Krumholzibacteria bacterium]|nr:M28 family peptidase [Candidatus Krumholzibacteria bacterium]
MSRTAPSDTRSRRVAAVLAHALAAAVLAAGCGADSAPVGSIDSAMVHVERQLSYGPRVPGTPARDRAARYLARTFERYGARVTLQSFALDDPYSDQPLQLINIVASFEPERRKRILLCSHYDSRPWADQEADSTLWSRPVPGAVDGAASTGALLEIARVIGRRAPANHGVDIVLFDGEDYGRQGDLEHYLLGSKHFVQNLGGYRPAGVILLDMVGGKGTIVRREALSLERSPALVNYVFGRAAALHLAYFEAVDGTPVYDDHVPFLQAGIPAIDLFGYDYPAWHTVGDDLSQVDRDKLAQVITLLVDIVYGTGLPAP